MELLRLPIIPRLPILPASPLPLSRFWNTSLKLLAVWSFSLISPIFTLPSRGCFIRLLVLLSVLLGYAATGVSAPEVSVPLLRLLLGKG